MYSFSALSNRFLEEKYNNQVIQDDYIAMGVYRATINDIISLHFHVANSNYIALWDYNYYYYLYVSQYTSIVIA